MAQKVTVDLASKLVIAKAGVTSLAVGVDLYSDLKEDWVANAGGELAFEFPIRTIGGDPIGGGLNAGAFFFLRNDLGWRIRPDEVDHELRIAGNLYGEDAALPVFVPTVGDFTVTVMLERSSLTQGADILATPANRLATDTGGRVTVGSNTDKAGYTLAADERNLVATALLDLANGVETSFTLRQTLRLMAAVLCGKVSGDVNTHVFRDMGDSADRVSATTDGSSHRTAITLNP